LKILRWAGLLIGVTIIAVLIRQVGWTEIRHSLTLLGWGYGVVLVYPILWLLANTQGWAVVVRGHRHRVPFSSLFKIRLAGESFNALLPSGYVGGEPLKAKLLSSSLPLRDAASSVIAAKAAQSVGLVLFIGLGLTWGGRMDQPGMISPAIQYGALAFLSVGVVVFITLLSRRTFSRIAGRLHGWTGHPWLARLEPKLRALDDSLGRFYREGKAAFFQSFFWHGLGWLLGALELSVIFYLIGHPITFWEAWFMGALAQLAAVIGLFAPAGVGMYEGGHYLAAQMLGLPPALGITAALIRRVRELGWNAAGLYFFWALSKSAPRRDPASPENESQPV